MAFVDFTNSKGVYLTRFVDPNVGAAVLPGQGGTSGNADTVCYLSGSTNTCPGIFAPGPFTNVGAITDTISNAKSLYRGLTVGLRKRMSHHFMFEAEYTYSVDRDDDSNERDPFTFRYANIYNLKSEYSLSDRDEPNKFNAYALGDLPFGFKANLRMQSHSAEPETDNGNGNGSGAPCSINNSFTRFVNGVDCGPSGRRVGIGRKHLVRYGTGDANPILILHTYRLAGTILGLIHNALAVAGSIGGLCRFGSIRSRSATERPR